MKCIKCGAEIPDGYQFCPFCGTKIFIPKENEPIKDFEFKLVKCGLNEMTDCVDLYRSFGFLYKEHQTIYNKQQSFNGAVTYSYQNFSFTQVDMSTNVDEFLVITFYRDRAMPHYKELFELEKIYSELKMIPEKHSYGGAIAHFVIGIVIALIVTCLAPILIPNNPMAALMFIAFAPAIILFIIGAFHYKKVRMLNEEEKEKSEKAKAKGKEIVEKAKRLVNEQYGSK